MKFAATLPIALVTFATLLSVALSVRVGALVLAVGLALLAVIAHLQRATRSPWRSQKSDVATLLSMAFALALLALLLP